VVPDRPERPRAAPALHGVCTDVVCTGEIGGSYMGWEIGRGEKKVRVGPAALASAVLGADPCCSSLRAATAVILLAELSACIVGLMWWIGIHAPRVS